MKPNTLHGRLKAARIRRGLSIREVERLTQSAISNTYISQLERGVEKGPSCHKLRLLSVALQIDYLELLMLAGYVNTKDMKGKA